MSHSPTATSSTDEILEYDKGWAAVNKMLRAGRSFSGYERKCAFLNLNGAKSERWATVSAATGADFPDDARGLALCDWDHDGRQDMWVTNRTAPRVRFLRNNWNTTGTHWLQLRLTGDGNKTARDAFGARIEITAGGQKLVKTLYGGSGYLSQSSRWLHFGLGGTDKIEKVTVRWPGGAAEEFTGVIPDKHFDLVQTTGAAKPWSPPAVAPLAAGVPLVPPLSDKARVVLLKPMPLPEECGIATGKPILLNYWLSTCPNCAAELKEWGENFDKLKATGLDLQLHCVDEGFTPDKAAAAAKALGWPGPAGVANRRSVELLNVLQRSVIGRQNDIPTPTTFLIDAAGAVAVIYKGPVAAEQIVADAKLCGASPDIILDAATPEPGGRWEEKPGGSPPRSFAVMCVEHGFRESAERYLLQTLPLYETATPDETKAAEKARLGELAEYHNFLGAISFDLTKFADADAHYQKALAIDPANRKVRLERIRTLEKLNNPAATAAEVEEVLKVQRQDPEQLLKLAALRIATGKKDAARPLIDEALALRRDASTITAAGNILNQAGDQPRAIVLYKDALKLDPNALLAANNLAWILATSQNAKLRDGKEAVRLAAFANQATAGRVPGILGTLAAAHAERGSYKDAIAAAHAALTIGEAAKDDPMIQSLRAKLVLYEKGQPFRE